MLMSAKEKIRQHEIDYYTRFRKVIAERLVDLANQLEYGYIGGRKIREPQARVIRELIKTNEEWLNWVGIHLMYRGVIK